MWEGWSTKLHMLSETCTNVLAELNTIVDAEHAANCQQWTTTMPQTDPKPCIPCSRAVTGVADRGGSVPALLQVGACPCSVPSGKAGRMPFQ